MYLIAQLWWYLLLAFLLGAVLGYLLWRFCGRRAMEHRFSAAAQAQSSKLQLDLSASETRAKSEIQSLASGDALRLTAEVTKVRTETETLWRTKHDGLVTSHETALQTAQLKFADDARALEARLVAKHADELKAAQNQGQAKVQTLLANDAKELTDEVARAKASAEAAARAVTEASSKKYADDLAAARRASEEEAKAHAAAVRALEVRLASTDTQLKGLLAERPPVLYGARDGKANDLKLIRGVGPQLEKQLNDLGIFHFDQIAAWNDRDLNWFEAHLREFGHRAERDKWIEQAKKLSGGWRPDPQIVDMPGSLPGVKPTLLIAARNGKADDLKLIWGVGPKLEATLHKLGVFHFDQIAGWTNQQVAWVEKNLGDFNDRVERDKWVEQSKKLSTGWRPESAAGDKPRP